MECEIWLCGTTETDFLLLWVRLCCEEYAWKWVSGLGGFFLEDVACE